MDISNNNTKQRKSIHKYNAEYKTTIHIHLYTIQKQNTRKTTQNKQTQNKTNKHKTNIYDNIANNTIQNKT